MEEYLFGVVYHPNHMSESNSEQHSHDMQLISWDGRPFHIHDFSGVTSFDIEHRHNYVGTTEPAPNGIPHTHRYYTVTTSNAGHSHVIRGWTGSAIELPGGGHYHIFEGVTSVNGRTPHSHVYSGKTTVS